MTLDLPPRFLFDFSVPISPPPPELSIDGMLREWPAEALLPRLCQLDEIEGFADVYLAGSADGLFLALHVPAKNVVSVSREAPWNADALQLWIDTRDVRNAHRGSRFCHEFVVIPKGGGPRKNKAMAWQRPIHRALEQAPMCEPSPLKVAARIRKRSYSMELMIPARALHGFDPAECSRLGFTYMVCDHEHGRQGWSAAQRSPFWHDPSTWATIELA